MITLTKNSCIKYGDVLYVPYPLATDVVLLAFALTQAQTAGIAWDQDKRARKRTCVHNHAKCTAETQ